MKIPQRYGYGAKGTEEISARALIREVLRAAEAEGLRVYPYFENMSSGESADLIINQFVLELQGTGEV